jgi:hypothetical protein
VDRSEPGGSDRAHDLESADLLRERLEASYSEAKEALDAADGDLLSALAYLEEKRKQTSPDLAQFLKELFEEARSVIDDKEVTSARVALRGQPLFTVPLALCGLAAGVVVLASAVLSDCRVEVTTGEREDEKAC